MNWLPQHGPTLLCRSHRVAIALPSTNAYRICPTYLEIFRINWENGSSTFIISIWSNAETDTFDWVRLGDSPGSLYGDCKCVPHVRTCAYAIVPLAQGIPRYKAQNILYISNSIFIPWHTVCIWFLFCSPLAISPSLYLAFRREDVMYISPQYVRACVC